MKLKFKATGNAPTHYSVQGDIITAHHSEQSEDFDLSGLEAGDKFEGVEPDTLDLPGNQIIRDAYRDESGELHVTLCQQVGPGHWSESDWIDTADYDPDSVQAIYSDRPHAGKAWALTREGKQSGSVSLALLVTVVVGAVIFSAGQAVDSSVMYLGLGMAFGGIAISVYDRMKKERARWVK